MKGFSITNGLADNGGGINISSTGGVLLENLNIYGSIDLTDFFNPKFDLDLIGDNISLSSSYDLFYGMGDADISISGKDTVLITGQLIPEP